MEVRLSEMIGRGFWGSHGAVKNGCKELVEAGGRGSGKSSFLSVELVLQLLKHPDCHAVVLRKVASTLRTSVYAQVLWAISAMGLADYFRCSLSPLECEYLPTGQKILFFGMDDAGKLKSLKMPWGYIGLAWFEELDQFDAEEVRSAEQSLFRGGQFSLSLKSFNPPGSEKHWVNRYFLEGKEGKFSHKSTYLELPAGWLGERFIGDAEHLKRVNPTLYSLEYLGIPVGSGNEVFPNLVLVGTPSQSASLTALPEGERGGSSWAPTPTVGNAFMRSAEQGNAGYGTDKSVPYGGTPSQSASLTALPEGERGGSSWAPTPTGRTPSPGERGDRAAVGEEWRQDRHRTRSDRCCDSQITARIPHPPLRGTFPPGEGISTASGVDWGWWPDPWAFNRVAYDAENRVLYILSELHCHRTGNRDTGLMVKNTIPAGETVIADGAEPKSIGDYRQLGLCCRSAKKGPGSVAYGLKWLQSLNAIVVDPQVCPETAREFAACRYVDGKIPDGNDHHIDAVRYASQVFWRN